MARVSVVIARFNLLALAAPSPAGYLEAELVGVSGLEANAPDGLAPDSNLSCRGIDAGDPVLDLLAVAVSRDSEARDAGEHSASRVEIGRELTKLQLGDSMQCMTHGSLGDLEA